jgi:glycosyltransferase involved in cell wall biosynthesis
MTGKEPPSVSVIMPMYNNADYIGEALESILAQTRTDYEIIVVDDGSTDRTADIVSEYAQGDNRLTLVHNTELPRGWTGKNYAIHLGLERGGGEYLAFVEKVRDLLEKSAREE